MPAIQANGKPNSPLKVSHGLRETRIKGNYAGGGITYGYEVVNKKFQICETEAPVVIRIYEMYAAGVIVKNIIKALTDEGIMYRNGRPFGKRISRNSSARL